MTICLAFVLPVPVSPPDSESHRTQIFGVVGTPTKDRKSLDYLGSLMSEAASNRRNYPCPMDFDQLLVDVRRALDNLARLIEMYSSASPDDPTGPAADMGARTELAVGRPWQADFRTYRSGFVSGTVPPVLGRQVPSSVYRGTKYLSSQDFGSTDASLRGGEFFAEAHRWSLRIINLASGTVLTYGKIEVEPDLFYAHLHTLDTDKPAN